MKTAPILEVDLSGVSTAEEMHARFAAAFSFPDYYGRNWDAFWDCITTLNPTPREIRVYGFGALTKALPVEAGHLKKCFHDYHAESDLSAVAVYIE